MKINRLESDKDQAARQFADVLRIGRSEAKALGQKVYFGGACKYCGGTMRYVSSRFCVPCKRKKNRSYQRQKKYPSVPPLNLRRFDNAQVKTCQDEYGLEDIDE